MEGFGPFTKWKPGVCEPTNLAKLIGVDQLGAYKGWLDTAKSDVEEEPSIEAMSTDDACLEQFDEYKQQAHIEQAMNKGPADKPLISSFMTTWHEFPTSFQYSCEAWICAVKAWMPFTPKIKRFTMTCPEDHLGKMFPDTIEEMTVEHPKASPRSTRLTVTTKGVCMWKEHFRKMTLRGAGDCLDLDLTGSGHGIAPGDEILVWLEFPSEPPRYFEEKYAGARYGAYLELRQARANLRRDGHRASSDWTTVRHERKPMIRYEVEEPVPKRGWIWKACHGRELSDWEMGAAYFTLGLWIYIIRHGWR